MDRLNTLTDTQTNIHIHTHKRKTFTHKFHIPDDSRFHSTGLELGIHYVDVDIIREL